MKEVFMKKEYDLKNMKERKNTQDRQANKVQISLRLDGSLIAKVKEEAHRLGIPYQTLVQSILHQYINGELLSSKELSRLNSNTYTDLF